MDRFAQIEATQWLLLAFYGNLCWFTVMLYLDMRKAAERFADSVRISDIASLAGRLDDSATKDEFEYTNARLTHLTEHLKKTGVIKPPHNSSKQPKKP